jgi:hypothetical protein
VTVRPPYRKPGPDGRSSVPTPSYVGSDRPGGRGGPDGRLSVRTHPYSLGADGRSFTHERGVNPTSGPVVPLSGAEAVQGSLVVQRGYLAGSAEVCRGTRRCLNRAEAERSKDRARQVARTFRLLALRTRHLAATSERPFSREPEGLGSC